MNKRYLAFPLVVILVFQIGCAGLLQNFRMGIASSRPFVQSLVPKVITQTRADAVTKDLTDGVDSALRGEQCIKAIPEGSKAERRVGKAKCYFGVAQDLRMILARHNIGGNDTLNTIAGIVQGAILAFEQYYSSVTTKAGRTESVLSGDPDKALEDSLKQKVKELKALTKQ